MQFERTIGIDYSGAETAFDGIKGLRVFMTEIKKPDEPAYEIPPTSGEEYWTRRELSKWLIKELAEPIPTIAGIDHAFSFPKEYFEENNIPRDWNAFLEDFCKHWPTDKEGVSPNSLRNSRDQMALARCGKCTWLRETEEQCRKRKYPPSSVFCFSGSKQVGPSTHAGLPFLLQIRNYFPKSKLHVWPFDGWKVPQGKSCLVEAYPSLYVDDYKKDKKCPQKPELPKKDRTWKDRRDAYAVAMWLRDMDNDKGELQSYLDLESQLPKEALERAKYEGWIIGTPKIEE